MEEQKATMMDLLNNEIGRQIGKENPYAHTKELEKLVINASGAH